MQSLSPLCTGLAERQNQVVAEERDRDTQHDIQLVEGHHTAARLGRRDLGNVHRCDNQCGTDTETTNHARDNQRNEIGRQRGVDGRHRKQSCGRHEYRAPPYAITDRTRDHHGQRGRQCQ